MAIRIACVHQGYELYGSDRSFVESVRALRTAFPAADITVILPRSGPIVGLLRDVAATVTVEPLWVLRRKTLLGLATVGLPRLVQALRRAVGTFRTHDLVYVNTCVVADYLLASRFFASRTLLHVHEIPEGLGRPLLRALVRWSGAEIIFNSKATAAAFDGVAAGAAHVVYNGVAGPPAPEATIYDGRRPLRVLLLGRVNRVKGQEVLLQALAMLPAAVRARIAVRMVGSAFESDARDRALTALIDRLDLSSHVGAEPFLPDPAPLYRWADIVVVPSRRPESLGRVAIEAMAFGRPVLASAIGGLREVVDDGRTGWLVPPGDATALAARLRAVAESHVDWSAFGAAARERYDALFTEEHAATAIAGIARAKLRLGDIATPARAPRPSTADAA